MKIRVKVTPNAKTNSIKIQRDLLTDEAIYVVRLTAKPIDGQANKALIAYLADYFAVPRRQVQLIQGHTSRWKVIEIDQEES